MNPRSIVTRWLLSFLVPGAMIVATAGWMSIPRNTRGVDLAAGHQQFLVHCGSCHFVKEGFPAHNGPNLHDIGRTAHSRRAGLSAEEYILESILDPMAFIAPNGRPGMPARIAEDLAPDAIRNIVGFLASCEAFPDYAKIARLPIPDRRRAESAAAPVRLETMRLAEDVLQRKGACLACHSLYSGPEDSVHAPPLFGAGLTDPQAIERAIVQPKERVDSKYRTVTIELISGKTISGRLLWRTGQSVGIAYRDSGNQLALREVSLSEIETDDGVPRIRESSLSLMPEGYDQSLSPDEIRAVVRLLRQLN